MDKVLTLGARLLMAQIFIISGFQKLIGYSGTIGYFSKINLPAPELLTPLVILVELGGGLALLFGFKVRWVAATLAVFTVVAALIAHTDFAAPGQLNNFLKNIAIAGGFLLFIKYGAGQPSIDSKTKND